MKTITCLLSFLLLSLTSGCTGDAAIAADPDGSTAGSDGGTRDASGPSDGGRVWTQEDCESGELTADMDGERCEGDFFCDGLCPCGVESIRCLDGVVSAEGDCTACPSDGGTTDGGATCESEIGALASLLYDTGPASTVTVRLDYETRAILGYQTFSGSYTAVDEATARSTSQADTGYGASGSMLNAATPEDEFVFYEAPGDFGGAGAVSADTGLTVFGGSIVWLGEGDITHPSSWRSATELGSGCPAAGGIVTRRGWDLRDGTALPTGDVDAAVEVVLDTAVPGALWRGGYVFDAVVLLYPRSMGAFNPATAEWIVLVNGGWLE